MNNEVNIIHQVLNGNTGSYRFLVDAYKDLVYSLVIKIVRNRELAEEVTQDSFLKAYHSLGSFKNESKFSTWLFRIAYNTAISRTRKKTITTSTLDDYVIENFTIDAVQENLDSIDDTEKLKILKLAMENLNEDEHLLIDLFYFHHQSIDEICQITGLTDSNVKVKLHRIRKKLYVNMDEKLKRIQVGLGM